MENGKTDELRLNCGVNRSPWSWVTTGWRMVYSARTVGWRLTHLLPAGKPPGRSSPPPPLGAASAAPFPPPPPPSSSRDATDDGSVEGDGGGGGDDGGNGGGGEKAAEEEEEGEQGKVLSDLVAATRWFRQCAEVRRYKGANDAHGTLVDAAEALRCFPAVRQLQEHLMGFYRGKAKPFRRVDAPAEPDKQGPSIHTTRIRSSQGLTEVKCVLCAAVSCWR